MDTKINDGFLFGFYHYYQTILLQNFNNQLKMEPMPVIKGWRNGVYYGGKVRFVHSLVMMMLFKPKTKANLFQLFRLTWQHAKNLGKFVFIYKLLVQILDKLFNKQLSHTFVAGLIGGMVAFGSKTAVSYQLLLYFMSRNFAGVMEWIYRRLWSHLSAKERSQMLKKYIYPGFASIVWGLVMFLFQYDKTCLQQSLVSSMQFIYKDSDEPLQDWRELVPVYIPKLANSS